ncbi:MAG: patatin-like phospholipase family protein [Rhizobiaceae bacterium]|nr:patatin-like phospholipase family protein [Rhizobiaceae bacterium]
MFFAQPKDRKISMSGSLRVDLFILILLVFMNGCATLPRTAVAEADQSAVEIQGFTGIRFWGDGPSNKLGPRKSMPILPVKAGQISYLVLSGGGSGGAFGAGILTGWTMAGTRPIFDIVSGVSTGALIAPFAFLGSSYDPALVELYTSGIAETLFRPRPILALMGSALSDPLPLRSLVERYATHEMLQQIAVEHAKGRRFFVATTNLDAQRTVIWDMGAIAASGHPQALALFRKVLIASASIPALFPPVMIDVTVNGKRFEEMHSDGGVTTQLFTAPESLLASNHGKPPVRAKNVDLYIILNSMLEPEFETVRPTTMAIAGRAYSTLVKTHARATVNATYTLTQRLGVNFNLTYLDEVVPYDLKDPFNTEYMRRLFAIGHEKALSANIWRKSPPAASDENAGVKIDN